MPSPTRTSALSLHLRQGLGLGERPCLNPTLHTPQTDYFHLFICVAIVAIYGDDVIEQQLATDQMLLHFGNLAMHMNGELVLRKVSARPPHLQSPAPHIGPAPSLTEPHLHSGPAPTCRAGGALPQGPVVSASGHRWGLAALLLRAHHCQALTREPPSLHGVNK